jgi:hypothetical protein
MAVVMPGQQVALLVRFTNQGLGEFLMQVPQTAPGGRAMRGLRSSIRPFNLRTTIDLLVIAGGAAGRAA